MVTCGPSDVNIPTDMATFRRKLVLTGLALTVLAVSAGRAQEVRSSATTQPEEPAPKQTLRVVGDRDYPPFCFLDNGIPSGFDIDIIRAVAKVMGLHLVIELKPWAEARQLLERGEADIIPGMARIPVREPDHEFSTPIKQMSFDLFVPRGSDISSLEDAGNATIVVQKGGVIYDLVKQKGILSRIEPVDDAPVALKRLVEGAFDGAIVNRVQGFHIISRENYRDITALNVSLPTIPYCLAVTKGRTALIDVLNEGLANIKADGTYDMIYNKWFSVYDDSASGPMLRRVLAVTGVIFLLLVLSATVSWSLRKQVRNRTAELRQIIDLVPFSIFARDRYGRYVLANQATAQSMGVAVQDIIGKRHHELHPGDPHMETYLREDRQVLENNHSIFIPEAKVTDRLGIQRTIQVTKIPFRIRDGLPTGVLCVVLDISEQKQAEEAVRSSRENLMIILNSIADGVIAIDGDGRIGSMNPVAERMTGRPARDVVGSRLGQALKLIDANGSVHPIDDILRLAMKDEGLAGLAQHLSLEAVDGSLRDVSLNWSPILKEKGRFAGLVLVMRDVTEENRLMNRLNETQRMESIGRLAGGVAHDFNNLLAGIIGYAELLHISLGDQHQGRAYLKGIFEASERARDLVQQLLAFSRRSSRERKTVDVHQVIGHFVSLLQHTLDRRITIHQQLHAENIAVLGDRTQLQNALINLGVNARDAMPSGGTLTITTRNMDLSDADCEQHHHPVHPGRYIEIRVTDTGIGMDRETMQHIFEPFYTTKGHTGGTGLGLAAVYGTVKDHNGYIDVASKPGHGTTFTLGFPVTANTVEAEEDPQQQAAGAGAGCVLIVDDEDLVMRTVNEILTSLGYRTRTASTGEEAIDIYRSSQSGIDLVLLDMIMPGISGEETFRELKKINPGIRVLISSGYMQDHRMDALAELGVIGVLQKPFRTSELASKVAAAIRPSPPRP